MDSIINLDGDNVQQAVGPHQNDNIVHIDVEPGTKKVLIQFLKCSSCSCEFSDAQHRVAHINVSHPKIMQKEAWTPCSKCHMRFPRKDILREHIKRVHHGGKSKCLICDEVFWTDALFRQHWKKCVAKWVKSAKNAQENAALESQLINQLQKQQQQQRSQHKFQDKQQSRVDDDESSDTASHSRVKSEPLAEDAKNDYKDDYLCAFCKFVFSTKVGYMEHTKLGQCNQPMHGKFTCPVPCYYCPGHCASRKALQLHVKEAHSIVRPVVKEEDEDEASKEETMRELTKKKHIYPCRPCNKKFDDHQDLITHQQLEHNECENCFKYFSQEKLENHKTEDAQGNKMCSIICTICGANPEFKVGEAYVDHMNEKHRSMVGVNWFQCVHCLKLNKRYYNRYYPTQKSLQLHLVSVHSAAIQPENILSLAARQVTSSSLRNQIVNSTNSTNGQTQEILQQFQIQIQDPSEMEGGSASSQGTQQIQIIQTEPNTPDQPQIITLYTWNGSH